MIISPALRALLDAIGKHEAPKGYDQLYSVAERKIGPHKLTAMRLMAIQRLQDRMLGAGSPSTALGRYQFIRKTLRDLVKDLKLTGSEIFDAALQDRLALALMERRGLSKYLAGSLSRTAFANNLAMEWASLPVVTRIKGQKRWVDPGESYYAGDGLNKAFHNPKHILALVDALRSPTPLADDPGDAQVVARKENDMIRAMASTKPAQPRSRLASVGWPLTAIAVLVAAAGAAAAYFIGG